MSADPLRGAAGALGRALILLLTAGFLILPIVVVIAVSLSSSVIFDLPSGGLSLRWYQRLWSLDSFWSAFATSFAIALAAAGLAMALGVPCALAIVLGRFPGREAVATFLVSPLMLPGLVFGIAALHALRAVGVYDARLGLLLAHVVITLPFVVRSALASLSLFDPVLLEAARTLGCSPARAVVKVLVPCIAPGILTGGLFAFIASFDNYATSLFLTDARVKTLPIQMLNYLDESPDPSLAAISTVLIAMTVVILLVCERIVGLRRLADV